MSWLLCGVVATCNVAPFMSMRRLGGVLCLLTWAGHNLSTVVALWWALDGGGGWVASLMLVVVGMKKQRHGNV